MNSLSKQNGINTVMALPSLVVQKAKSRITILVTSKTLCSLESFYWTIQNTGQNMVPTWYIQYVTYYASVHIKTIILLLFKYFKYTFGIEIESHSDLSSSHCCVTWCDLTVLIVHVQSFSFRNWSILLTWIH